MASVFHHCAKNTHTLFVQVMKRLAAILNKIWTGERKIVTTSFGGCSDWACEKLRLRQFIFWSLFLHTGSFTVKSEIELDYWLLSIITCDYECQKEQSFILLHGVFHHHLLLCRWFFLRRRCCCLCSFFMFRNILWN